MLTRFHMAVVALFGILLLTAVLRPASAQEIPRGAPGEHELRTWTDRSGTFRTDAGLIDVRVTMKRSDGTVITVPLETLSDADRDYVRRKVWGDGTASAPAEAARRAGTPVSSGISKANEVVVTGVGVDPRNALQNAFSLAIEQTVGLLVDAETLVRNDQLIRDEILTHSRGYVETFDVVSQRQEGEFHRATIRAVVARDKLREKLRGIKIAVHALPGERAALQIDFDAKNEEQAAEMLSKALAEFDMTKLTKVEIVGKPQIAREGSHATVTVTVKLSPDLAQWRKFSPDVRRILDKTATRRGAVTLPLSIRMSRDSPLQKQLEGHGVLVSLFVSTNILGDRTQWTMFRVPEPMDEAIRIAASRMRYRLVYVLLDEQGRDLVRTTVLRSEGSRYRGLGTVIQKSSIFRVGSVWWIGPVWWQSRLGDKCVPVFETDATVQVSQKDLSKVAKTVVFLEEDSEESEPTRTILDPTPGRPAPGGIR